MVRHIDQFEIVFAETYPHFTNTLIKRFDNLSYSEIRVCMYVRMGYPNEKIIKNLRISKHTLANLRSSIRKKLGLKRNQELAIIIMSI